MTELSQNDSGVTAVYEDLAGGGTQTVQADYCICTIPLSILSQLKLKVGAELEAAIRKVPYAPSFKAGIQYKRRFWEQDDEIFGGITYTDQEIQTLSYPANNYLSQGKGVVLSAYMFGPDAVRFTGMNPADRMKEVLRQNTQIHPQAQRSSTTASAWAGTACRGRWAVTACTPTRPARTRTRCCAPGMAA